MVGDDSLFYLFTGIVIGWFACGVIHMRFPTKKKEPDVLTAEETAYVLKTILELEIQAKLKEKNK